MEELKNLLYSPRESTNTPFGEIFEIWADFAEQELKKRVSEKMDILSKDAAQKLKSRLVQNLSFFAAPTFATLMRIVKNDNQLVGNTPKERYLYFIEKVFFNPLYLNDVFAHFQPLKSRIESTILLWIDQAEELLVRLHQDKEEIALHFGVGLLGKVVDLSPSLSDLHNGNRSVYKLVFENGLNLIYKPKNLQIDKAFNHFLDQLQLGLKSYKILAREDYGWVEFIETLPCKSKEEVKEFYKKLGMLIALMYLLDGSDCHYENIIACGPNPVLIDLESLFHPFFKSSIEMEMEVWSRSVFRTTFLPSFGISAEKKMSVSPLTVNEKEAIPTKVPRWKAVNTDEMEVAFVDANMPIDVPRPYFQNRLTQTIDYLEDLLLGFKTLYLLFMNQKNQILKFLKPLFQLQVRCILKPTQLYFLILGRLTDPRLMRHPEEREKAFEVLRKYTAKEEFDERIFAAEKEALLRGDIPFFLSMPNDTTLYALKGPLVKGFFQFSVAEDILKKMDLLSFEDLERQLTFIDHSLYYLKIASSPKMALYHPGKMEKRKPLSSTELRRFAEAIGEKIIQLGLPNEDGSLAWISLEYNPDAERYVFQPLSYNLYSGTSGIALFLAAIGKAGPAKAILDRIHGRLFKNIEAVMLTLSLGGMTGIGSLIYAFLAVSNLTQDEKYQHHAQTLISHISKEQIEKDLSLDLISGAAGLILALLYFYKNTNYRPALECALLAGDHLIKSKHGLAWNTYQGKPLCGFAHGAAGIAFALAKLGYETKQSRYTEAALQGFLYERKLYSPEKQNWPDLRYDVPSNPFSWCHGAPGIGLSRLYASQILPNPELKADLELAINATIQHLHGFEDHLCCGNFGRVHFLMRCAEILKRKDLQEIADQETAGILESFSKKGNFHLFYNLPEEMQSPCFMRGLAGIGYLLLQMAKESLPEVLTLSSPGKMPGKQGP